MDEGDRKLAERAAARLGLAGRRALAVRDTHGSVALLTRSARLLESDHPERPATLAELGEALRNAGQLELADSTLVDGIEAAKRLGKPAAEAHALVVRWQLRIQTDPQVSFDDAASAFAAAIDRLEALADERLLAKAWIAASEVPWLRGRAAATQQALERGLTYARSARETRSEFLGLPSLLGVALYGPMFVKDAIERCEEMLAEARPEGLIAASTLRALAGLYAMDGRFEQAWSCIDRDRAILRDLGLRVVVSSSAGVAGLVGLLADDPARAETELRWGYEIVEGMGDRNGLSDLAAHLAEAVLLQGRDAEALALTELSEEVGAGEDLPVQIRWRSARARALARRGELRQAEQLASGAVALAERTDFLNLHGDALMAFAEVLRLDGRLPDARVALATAADLYEQKGNVVSAAQARERIGAPAPRADAPNAA